MSFWDDYWKSDYGAGGIARGLGFGRQDPYKDAMKEYERWMQRGQNAQDPFYNAGKDAIGGYKDWLGGMKDPSAFINKMMGDYHESPMAHNLQNQAMRGAQNMGSASGMTGSTPLMQFAQKNAGDISSQDQNQWLQNVLGINSEYGQGMGNMMGMGQHSADQLSNMYQNMGGRMGEARYGRGQQMNNNSDQMMAFMMRMLGMGGGGGFGGGFR